MQQGDFVNSSTRTTSRAARRSQLLGGVVALLIGMLVLVMPNSASAVPPPVDGGAGYPSPLPASCGVDGGAVVVGESFTLGGVTSSSMRDLPQIPGATLTLTWESFAPGCEQVGISLSAKTSSSPQFDPSTDQYLLPGYDYCGPLGPGCPDSGPYQLAITVPTPEVAACYQLDAAIGAPLAIVGPSGSFYGLNQSQNMLISALNGGNEPCVATQVTTTTTASPPTTVPASPVTVVCATNPALPADSPDCGGGSSDSTIATTPTVLGSTTIVTTPAATVATTSTTSEAGSNSATTSTTPTASGGGGASSSVSGQPEASVLGATTIAGALATTGADSGGPVGVGAAFLLAGLLLVFVAARTRAH